MSQSRGRPRPKARSTAEPPFSGRISRLRRVVRAKGLDALLITNANDIRYLTGFSGEDSWAIVTVGGAPGLVVISDFRFQEELAALVPPVRTLIRKGAITQAAIGLVRDLRLARIGLQAEYLTVATRAALSEGIGAKRVSDSVGLLDGLRVIKDEAEQAIIRKAVRVQEGAMQEVRGLIRPGMKESLVAAMLDFAMKSRGADSTSFETNVSAQANGSKPHHRPDDTKLKRNSPLLIDWGARVQGYCSDMTRSFHLGRWSPVMREVYKVVLDAHLAGIDAVRPGATGREVDAVARAVIDRAGYADKFGHGLGHGIGINIHESPRLASVSDTVLRPGMVVTIEPGIYLPGVGGVRIEDDIVVTDRGRRNLCSLPKDLHWATIHG
ncbi:MAG TPA: hypothetical protein DEB06_01755 [Phycisphaerales bacterium]|nr:hypothetical protein [Phycisphaerales bacterium]